MKQSGKPVVMIFSDYYLPGYMSGGGMRTIVNMVDRLGHKYDFRIVTRDHDGKADHKPYPDVDIDAWNSVGGASVYYLSRSEIRVRTLRKLIREVSPTIIYTNSLLSTLAIYVLKLRKLGRIDDCPFVIAPCGELSTGALELKRSKKKIFFKYAKLIKLYRNIIWKASSDLEADEVRMLNPSNATVLVAPDLPPNELFREYRPELKPGKIKGEARLVFVSRFEPKKNMNWVLPILGGLTGKVRLDIAGPIQDWEYYKETRTLVADLPENIEVNVIGPVPHEDVCPTMAGYHFFLCPTLGENFGHIFLEAMAAGCPLLISDRTPWKELRKKGIGWEISLEQPDRWAAILQECIDMENEEYRVMSSASRIFVTEWLKKSGLEEQTESVLDHAIEMASSGSSVSA